MTITRLRKLIQYVTYFIPIRVSYVNKQNKLHKNIEIKIMDYCEIE